MNDINKKMRRVTSNLILCAANEAALLTQSSIQVSEFYVLQKSWFHY